MGGGGHPVDAPIGLALVLDLVHASATSRT